jgi:hypothetical protein
VEFWVQLSHKEAPLTVLESKGNLIDVEEKGPGRLSPAHSLSSPAPEDLLAHVPGRILPP